MCPTVGGQRANCNNGLGWVCPTPLQTSPQKSAPVENSREDQIMSDHDSIFIRHPKPWRLHPDYPRSGFSADSDGVILDANGTAVLWSSEWFGAEAGVLETILAAVNRNR